MQFGLDLESETVTMQDADEDEGEGRPPEQPVRLGLDLREKRRVLFRSEYASGARTGGSVDAQLLRKTIEMMGVPQVLRDGFYADLYFWTRNFKYDVKMRLTPGQTRREAAAEVAFHATVMAALEATAALVVITVCPSTDDLSEPAKGVLGATGLSEHQAMAASAPINLGTKTVDMAQYAVAEISDRIGDPDFLMGNLFFSAANPREKNHAKELGLAMIAAMVQADKLKIRDAS